MSADAEDAARYRWLRDHTGNALMRKLMKECRPEGWDALVDAERRRLPRRVPREHEWDTEGKCQWCPAIREEAAKNG